jgi:hypothetical protein
MEPNAARIMAYSIMIGYKRVQYLIFHLNVLKVSPKGYFQLNSSNFKK